MPSGCDDNAGDVPLGSVALSDGTTFDIFLTGERYDSISAAIANQTYVPPPAYELLADLVPRPGKVLDLGAHIGTFALYATALGYTVLAVEASPRNSTLLEASIQRNGFDNIRLVSAAISDRSGVLEFRPAGPFGFVANPIASGPTISVRSVTGDELVAEAGWELVDFIKMDIEGSEVAALKGMADLLSQANAPAILYESNGYTLSLFGQTPQSLGAILESFGYDCYVIRSNELIRTTSADPQPACNVDCLALKSGVQPPWRIIPRLSSEEIAEQFLASCGDTNKHVREYAARALAQRESTYLLHDARIRAALEKLRSDPEPAVRAAAT